jgi:hypothetical protein
MKLIKVSLVDSLEDFLLQKGKQNLWTEQLETLCGEIGWSRLSAVRSALPLHLEQVALVFLLYSAN